MKLDTSRSQRRAADALGIAYDPRSSYASLALKLEAVGASGDGIPTCCRGNWRQAAKLSDSELAAQLRETSSDDGETLRSAYGE